MYSNSPLFPDYIDEYLFLRRGIVGEYISHAFGIEWDKREAKKVPEMQNKIKIICTDEENCQELY